MTILAHGLGPVDYLPWAIVTVLAVLVLSMGCSLWLLLSANSEARRLTEARSRGLLCDRCGGTGVEPERAAVDVHWHPSGED